MGDQDECIFEIFIKDGTCTTHLYYPYYKQNPEIVKYETIMAPVKLGVSLNSERNPMSVEIIHQERPFET